MPAQEKQKMELEKRKRPPMQTNFYLCKRKSVKNLNTTAVGGPFLFVVTIEFCS